MAGEGEKPQNDGDQNLDQNPETAEGQESAPRTDIDPEIAIQTRERELAELKAKAEKDKEGEAAKDEEEDEDKEEDEAEAKAKAEADVDALPDDEEEDEEEDDEESEEGADPDEDEDDGEKADEEDAEEEEEGGEGFFGKLWDHYNKAMEKHKGSLGMALGSTALYALKLWWTEGKDEDREEGADPDQDQDEDADAERTSDSDTDDKEADADTESKYTASLKKQLADYGIDFTDDPKKNFFNAASKMAEEIEDEYGIPHQVTLAQACLESNYGQSGLTQKAMNCFGFKTGGSYEGESVTMKTTEHIDGSDQRVNAKFRSYDSLKDSFEDYARLLTTSKRYKKAFEHKDDPKQFLAEVIKGGYATDPNYVSKAEGVLKAHDMTLVA